MKQFQRPSFVRSALLFGPAEFGESLGDARERQADDVEVAAFDAGDVAASAALDSVGAGFVIRLFGGKVAGDFLGGERGEMHMGGFDESAALGVGEADEGDASDDGVSSAGEFFEQLTGVLGRVRLADDAAVEGDHGVGGDDDGRADGAGSDEFGFGVGEPLDVIVRGFAGERRFVDGGGEHGEGNRRVAQDFSAAGRGGCEDELHCGS